MKVGIIGCGNIVGAYIRHSKQFKDIIQLAGFADIDMDQAKKAAEEFGDSSLAVTTDELLVDPEISLIVNLTPPKAHANVAMMVLAANKHVYNEKPLSIERDDAKKMLEFAKSAELRIGCAPDTFLGTGIQTAMKVIDDGLIGFPVAAFAQMANHGMEHWHPNPEFFYEYGGGPMFDIGPYILTALVTMLGPVKRVTGSTKITFPVRTIKAEARMGDTFKVEVPTHITGVLDFEQGAIATIITSFDMHTHNLPKIEIYGSEGTISIPDPNQFGGEVKVWTSSSGEWETIPLLESRSETGRSIGVADMAQAIEQGRPHRANGELAYHVLDLMHSIHDASKEGKHIELASTCKRPAPLLQDL
ncbi:MAG: Gfo/Idh/MocA family oxidoreductase [Anaerolineaceae bacterium]|nr:Gfo/Idh/MocA family oxidoreductase [Anaerolineaceae bacterium]